MKVLAKAHRFITFTTPPNLQAAVAYGLAKDDDYFLGMRRDLQAARDRFAGGLAAAGLDVLPSRATYFLNIDLATVSNNLDDSAWRTAERWLGNGVGIPVSSRWLPVP